MGWSLFLLLLQRWKTDSLIGLDEEQRTEWGKGCEGLCLREEAAHRRDKPRLVWECEGRWATPVASTLLSFVSLKHVSNVWPQEKTLCSWPV